MKLRTCVLVLAVILLLGLTTPAAHGVEKGFTATRIYKEQFTDVPSNAWYHDLVKALYELGLINGKGTSDHFAPEDNMALSEVLTLAARLRSLYYTGSSETGRSAYGGDGGTWYLPYVAYLQAEKVIGREFEGRYEQPATRAEIAHVLANTLPQDFFVPRNRETVAEGRASGQFMRDVGVSTAYAPDIVLLYDWGILSGADAVGSFLPDQSISRCEVAAMSARLAYDELRLTLEWKVQPAYIWQGSTLADLVSSDGTFYKAPNVDNTDEIAADIRYMLSRGERNLMLQYGSGVLNSKVAGELANAFLSEVRQYVEQTYNFVSCASSQQTGMLSLEFSSSLYDSKDLEKYRKETLDYALTVHNQLWAEGKLTAAMSEYEKAKVYFTWVCENCRYDFDAVGAENSMSHSGWRLFTEGVAVCDGYTAAYNLLLKLEGIECGTYTLDSENHIWTVAELDGTTYHIDATWGDQTGQVAYRFFGMTEAEAFGRFSHG